MRVRNYSDANNNEINSNSGKLSNRQNFHSSTERKIERLRFQSKQLGWSYSDFVVHLMGVLVVIRHRNRAKLAMGPKRKINRANTP
jgi:hypothetical protein